MKNAILRHAVSAVMGAALLHGGTTIFDNEQGAAYQGLVEQLKVEEGYREHVYSDTQGVETIGYGFNLDQGIPEPAADWLLNFMVERDGHAFAEGWEPFETMPADVQVALIDMSYEVGAAGLLRFHTMLRLLSASEWDAAADDALKTAWASQASQSRVDRVIAAFRSHAGGTP